MKRLLVIVIFLLYSTNHFSQTVISGRILTQENEPVAGANIYLKNTYEGTMSDSSGEFSFQASHTGSRTLIISYLGFKTCELPVTLIGEPVEIQKIVLTEDAAGLDEVVCAAGIFEASDEKKSVVLSTLDMASNSNGFGDIFGAVALLPGTSNAEEEGGLLVRGGDIYETKTFIDGLLVESPYTAKLPSVPVRGRFSPMLFKGTAFSTGGYSAEFGQALSSALVLNTVGLAEKDETSFGVYSVGIHFTKTTRWKKTSLTSVTDYNNLTPYYRLAKTNIDWVREPHSFNQTLIFRQKAGKKGMLKSMGTYNTDKSSLFYMNTNTFSPEFYVSENHNVFGLISYKTELKSKWLLHSGFSAGSDKNSLIIGDDRMSDHNLSGEIKLVLKNEITEGIFVKFGGNQYWSNFTRRYASQEYDTLFRWTSANNMQAAFTESEMNISKRVTIRIGGRMEKISEDFYLAPRLSLAYKPFSRGQFSAGYGVFTQQAQDDYLIYNRDLMPEQAGHYMVNYQLNHNGRTFRIEGYYKKYGHLVKFDSLYAIEAAAFNNRGKGYARGIDFFYRDKTSFLNGDAWIAYSFIDTKRDYQDYKKLMIPGYIARHNFTIVYKHYISSIDAYVSLSYKLSSGRPYINPNIDEEKQFFTRAGSNLSFNFFYFTRILQKFTMLHLHVSNVLGTKNIYGYCYSKTPDENGVYERHAIRPAGKRFIIFGIYFALNGPPEM